MGNLSSGESQRIWFEHHVVQHEPWLRRQLGALVSPCDVDDIVQDCFVKLLSSEALGHVDNPCGLLYRVARNLVIDRHRRKARIEFVALDPDLGLPNGEVGIDQAYDACRAAERVFTALDAMPAGRRRIFQLSRFGEMTQKALAAEVGLSVSAVEKSLRTTIATLRRVRDGEQAGCETAQRTV